MAACSDMRFNASLNKNVADGFDANFFQFIISMLDLNIKSTPCGFPDKYSTFISNLISFLNEQLNISLKKFYDDLLFFPKQLKEFKKIHQNEATGKKSRRRLERKLYKKTLGQLNNNTNTTNTNTNINTFVNKVTNSIIKKI